MKTPAMLGGATGEERRRGVSQTQELKEVDGVRAAMAGAASRSNKLVYIMLYDSMHLSTLLLQVPNNLCLL